MMDQSTTDNLSEPLRNLDLDPSHNQSDQESAVQFFETIPTLQSMASYEVAIESWRQFIRNEDPNRDTYYNPEHVFYFLDEKDEAKVNEILHQLPLPRSIRHLVEKCLGPVRIEMSAWARYYVQSVFISRRFQLDGAIKISDLLFCNWLPNGKIDHRRTASNMLSNPRMTPVDRFEIMCRYCFVDEIKKFPIECIPEDFTKNITFDKNPLVCYWLSYLRDDLDKLPVKNGECVESFLITAPQVDSWSAVEYFWNRLSFNEQISKALVLLSRKPHFQKQMFSIMNEFQKRHVLSTMPIDIVKNFWKQESCERFAFLSWTRCVDTISFGRFTGLVEDLLTVSLPDHEDRIRYLVKMWDCSPSHYKTRALEIMSKKVIRLHTEVCWTRWDDETSLPSNMDFLLAFLASASGEFRKKVLVDHVDKFIFRSDSDMIDGLVKLCLSSAEDIDEFREFLFNSPKIRNMCYDMLVGSFEDRQQLANFLIYYFPGADVKADFINSLILCQSWSDDCMEIWNDAISLIKVNLIDIAPEAAKIIKKRIIRTFASTRVQFEWNLHHVRQFINEISAVLDPQELLEYKNTALETFRSKYEWFKFRQEDIRGFFQWCFDEDEQKIAQFKKSLSVDDIFEHCWKSWKRAGFFEKNLGQQEVRQEFAHLDRILLWYFQTPEDVKTYKLKKVFEFFDCAGLEINEVFASNVLPWFFNGDRAEIVKFKEYYKDDAIAQMIKVPGKKKRKRNRNRRKKKNVSG